VGCRISEPSTRTWSSASRARGTSANRRATPTRPTGERNRPCHASAAHRTDPPKDSRARHPHHRNRSTVAGRSRTVERTRCRHRQQRAAAAPRPGLLRRVHRAQSTLSAAPLPDRLLTHHISPIDTGFHSAISAAGDSSGHHDDHELLNVPPNRFQNRDVPHRPVNPLCEGRLRQRRVLPGAGGEVGG
jgi:hypothetical protein